MFWRHHSWDHTFRAFKRVSGTQISTNKWEPRFVKVVCAFVFCALRPPSGPPLLLGCLGTSVASAALAAPALALARYQRASCRSRVHLAGLRVRRQAILRGCHFLDRFGALGALAERPSDGACQGSFSSSEGGGAITAVAVRALCSIRTRGAVVGALLAFPDELGL